MIGAHGGGENRKVESVHSKRYSSEVTSTRHGYVINGVGHNYPERIRPSPASSPMDENYTFHHNFQVFKKPR